MRTDSGDSKHLVLRLKAVAKSDPNAHSGASKPDNDFDEVVYRFTKVLTFNQAPNALAATGYTVEELISLSTWYEVEMRDKGYGGFRKTVNTGVDWDSAHLLDIVTKIGDLSFFFKAIPSHYPGAVSYKTQPCPIFVQYTLFEYIFKRLITRPTVPVIDISNAITYLLKTHPATFTLDKFTGGSGENQQEPSALFCLFTTVNRWVVTMDGHFRPLEALTLFIEKFGKEVKKTDITLAPQIGEFEGMSTLWYAFYMQYSNIQLICLNYILRTFNDEFTFEDFLQCPTSILSEWTDSTVIQQALISKINPTATHQFGWEYILARFGYNLTSLEILGKADSMKTQSWIEKYQVSVKDLLEQTLILVKDKGDKSSEVSDLYQSKALFMHTLSDFDKPDKVITPADAQLLYNLALDAQRNGFRYPFSMLEEQFKKKNMSSPIVEKTTLMSKQEHVKTHEATSLVLENLDKACKAQGKLTEHDLQDIEENRLIVRPHASSEQSQRRRPLAP